MGKIRMTHIDKRLDSTRENYRCRNYKRYSWTKLL